MVNEVLINIQDVTIYSSPSNNRRYYKNNIIVSDVNVKVSSGELVYLIGKVGSGKSSLLKTLYAEIPLRKGRVRIGEYDLSKIKKRQIPYLRRSLGLVFQDFQLLPDRTVYENLKFFLRATGWRNTQAINRRIDEILTTIGLRSRVNSMPYHLSGGEQQRLAIGRALLNRPHIILADEPTGNLDPVTSAEIMELFFEIASMGCCVMLATHNISLIDQYPSRVLLFADNTVQEVSLDSLEDDEDGEICDEEENIIEEY